MQLTDIDSQLAVYFSSLEKQASDVARSGAHLRTPDLWQRQLRIDLSHRQQSHLADCQECRNRLKRFSIQMPILERETPVYRETHPLDFSVPVISYGAGQGISPNAYGDAPDRQIGPKWELLEAAAEDENYFPPFILSIHNTMIRYITGIVTCPACADEVWQEVSISIYKALPDYEPQGKPQAWVYRIAYNASVTYLRRERQHRQTASANHLHSVVQESSDISATIDAREELHRIMECLAPEERDLLTRHYLEGKGYSEHANELGIEEPALRKRLQRVRDKVRRELDPPHQSAGANTNE